MWPSGSFQARSPARGRAGIPARCRSSWTTSSRAEAAPPPPLEAPVSESATSPPAPALRSPRAAGALGTVAAPPLLRAAWVRTPQAPHLGVLSGDRSSAALMGSVPRVNSWVRGRLAQQEPVADGASAGAAAISSTAASSSSPGGGEEAQALAYHAGGGGRGRSRISVARGHGGFAAVPCVIPPRGEPIVPPRGCDGSGGTGASFRSSSMPPATAGPGAVDKMSRSARNVCPASTPPSSTASAASATPAACATPPALSAVAAAATAAATSAAAGHVIQGLATAPSVHSTTYFGIGLGRAPPRCAYGASRQALGPAALQTQRVAVPPALNHSHVSLRS
mmetsp:Transcript_75626/g.234637  ORF Transcript_75626/g.234637 Transcript_75626/m.234637 type:complete len:337 (-) Transcript_75626:8-1018(-)